MADDKQQQTPVHHCAVHDTVSRIFNITTIARDHVTVGCLLYHKLANILDKWLLQIVQYIITVIITC